MQRLTASALGDTVRATHRPADDAGDSVARGYCRPSVACGCAVGARRIRRERREQNLTYVALLQPEIAYVVDIRRENLLEHLVLRAAIEEAETPEAFLGSLVCRAVATDPAIAAIGPRSGTLLAKASARTLALARRLEVRLDAADREAVLGIHQAFFDHGLGLRYSMVGSRRRYPTLAQNLSATGPEGRRASFVADRAGYRSVRELLRQNRLVPVVGDFGGAHALRGVAADMRARSVTLGVFYASNVEEYLLPGEAYSRFVENLRAMPADDRSRILRVWFDRGRAHPREREGRRVTSLVMPLSDTLERWAKRPFRSYWQVVAPEGPTPDATNEASQGAMNER